MRIVNCRVDHMINPIGYQMDRPVFSYVVIESKGTKQSLARIRVGLDFALKEVIADTGWTQEIDSLAHALEISLQPCTRYYWSVSVETDAAEVVTSPVNWFETGKKDQQWQAKWITCREKTGRHPIFSKKITHRQPVINARLYICGLGLYEAYFDKEKIGNEFLTPYCNDYDEWLQYQTYDVTEQLRREGELSIHLGNGWFKGRFGFEQTDKENHYGDGWELIAELRIEYSDGTTEVLGTDESWTVRYGKILSSSIYDGEIVDGTLAFTSEESVLMSARTTEKLKERLSTPVMIQEELPAVALLHTPLGETVLDIGQNQAGIFRLLVHEPAGTKIHLQFGEILQNGNFYRENLRTAKAEYIYISDGTAKVLQPAFTFYGYRYVKIEGITDLKKEDFTACVLYSYLPKIGYLETGNQKVNQLIQNTEWGLKSNFIDVPTDCPQRDERMGWTGDAQVFSQTAYYLRDSYAFYRKYLFDLAQEQKSLAGKVPNYIPSFGDKGTSSVWGDAVCVIPWNVYLFSGDKEILRQQFASMEAWIAYIQKVDGDDLGWDQVFHFGDWLALDKHTGVKNEVMGATPIDFIARVYYMHSVRLTAKAAAVIGKDNEAAYYHEQADKILQHIQNEYYSVNGRSVVNTQTGLLMGLHFQLMENKEKITAALKEKFEETNHKLETGFVGTALLCNVLSENGLEELAYELLLNEEFPGWLYAVNLGATTIWERWSSVSPDGTVSDSGMNSLNHYSYGSIVEWIFKHCAGIQPREDYPGFRKIILAPTLNWKLRHLHATYETPAGTYQVKWELKDSTQVVLEITIPFGCEARLTLPLAPVEIFADRENPIFQQIESGKCVLGPGSYAISYELTKNVHQILSTYTPIKELLYHSQAKGILMQMSPTLLDTPVELRHLSMRELSQQYTIGNDELKAQMAVLMAHLDNLLGNLV